MISYKEDGCLKFYGTMSCDIKQMKICRLRYKIINIHYHLTVFIDRIFTTELCKIQQEVKFKSKDFKCFKEETESLGRNTIKVAIEGLNEKKQTNNELPE